MPLKLWERFQSASFFKKLFLCFLVLCILPLLLTIHFLYSQGRTTIQAATTDFIQLYVSQLNTTLNNYLLQIDYTSRSIFSDYELIAYLQGDTAYPTGERIKNNLLVSRQLNRFADQLPYVEGVQIISKSGKLYSTGNVTERDDYQALLEQRWFQDIVQAGGQLVITPYYGKTTIKEKQFDVFTAGRLIKDQQGEMAGVILFELSSASLITIDNRLFALRDQYDARILVRNKEEELLFEMNPDYEYPAPALAGEVRPIAPAPEPNGSVLSIVNRSPATGISVTVHVPTRNLYKKLDVYRNLSILITLLVLAVIIPASIWISYQITKPIQRLIFNMKHVEQGYYRPILEASRSDELGTLTMHYNQMIVKIKHLIEDVLTARIKHNEARFLALQNQINPHWLNNTLESIRMEAQLSQAPEVARMIQSLGRLFRMALNKSNRTNRIRDEIEYVRTYVDLQNIRFDNRFHLHVKLDEPMPDVHFPKMIFQPLVENSIVHGFLRHDRDYRIVIEGCYERGEEGDRCTITIRDDGEGMAEERLEQIRKDWLFRGSEPDGSESLGLRNIMERLQLQYGNDLHMDMSSSPGQGTAISFAFPVLNQPDLSEKGVLPDV